MSRLSLTLCACALLTACPDPLSSDAEPGTETYTETVVVEGAGGLGGGALAAALVAFIVGAAAAYLASRRLGG